MNINPFVIAGKIEEKYFCDRVNESTELIHLINNQNNLLLVSPRRMGKTGLIKFCFEKKEIKKNYLTFFLDILQTTSLKEFTFLLGREIYDTLLPASRKIADSFLQILKSINGKLSYDPVSNAPSFNLSIGEITHPEYTLKEIFGFLEKAGKRCVVAIDEFQQITKYPEKNVEAILRTYIQNSGNCNFIFAGSRRHILHEMFFSASRPFYQSVSLIELNPIPPEIYVEFAIKNFKEFGKEINREEIIKVYNYFEGHTFYIQRVMNQIFSTTKIGEKCSLEIIRDAVDYSVNLNATLYREILSNIPESQKEVLFAVAKTGHVSKPTSSEFIKKNGLRSASSVQGALRKLLDLDLLSRQENVYFLTDRFLLLWINQTYGRNPRLPD